MIAASLFWAAAAALAYTYVGFPVMAIARALVRPRPVRAAAVTPSVTFIIAAHNEEHVIGRKLENLLQIDYAPELVEMIVASDGSEDGTEEVVASYSGSGVRLLSLPRVGKAQALNAAITAAQHDVLVFTDANSMLEAGALRVLVRPLADPAVGGVAGDQRYVRGEIAGGLATGEQRYWDFDRLLKLAESRAGSVISATGAIYALRRELAGPVPEGVTDDFFLSTGVIVQGRRLVFAAQAVAYEPVAATGDVEFSRKVRIMTRGLRGVAARRTLLDPRRHGFYSLQLLSHKVLRRLMAVPLVVIAGTAPLLMHRHPAYKVATATQGLFYLSGLIGLLRLRAGASHDPLALPAYFCLVNAASIKAVWNLVRGHRIERWEPRRHEADPGSSARSGREGSGA